jgi:multidrug resistance efflux pump
MLELLLSALITVLPDYLYRRYAQGKRFGHEITLYNFWYELRWGITAGVGALREAQDELARNQEVAERNPALVSEQEVERLRAVVKSRQGALDAARAQLDVVQAQISSLLPAQRASAEAALAQAEVEIDKGTVFAGVDGTVKQFVLKPGDIVNPILRPAGILVPATAGSGVFQAGFRQISAQVLRPGMVMEITCPSKSLTVYPMVVREVQDAIAGGQLRPTDQLIDIQERARPGTVVAILKPIFEDDSITKIPPGAVCVGVAYSNHTAEVEAGEIDGITALALRLADGMGIANAIVIRAQALLLPIRAIVFPG